MGGGYVGEVIWMDDIIDPGAGAVGVRVAQHLQVHHIRNAGNLEETKNLQFHVTKTSVYLLTPLVQGHEPQVELVLRFEHDLQEEMGSGGEKGSWSGGQEVRRSGGQEVR